MLVGFGVLVLLFVAYLLWGTGISEASHQHALRQQFQHEIARIKAHESSSSSSPSPSPSPSCSSSPSTPSSSTTTTPRTPGMQSPVPGTVPVEGQPVGIIQIPKIAVNKVVVEG
ncbi:MAG: hypothetical protein ABSH04_07915, partial [Acidimicrobiales bacterium]